MKIAKVFDFHNYGAASNLFEQDEDLSTITDPVKRLEFMKTRLSQKVTEI